MDNKAIIKQRIKILTKEELLELQKYLTDRIILCNIKEQSKKLYEKTQPNDILFCPVCKCNFKRRSKSIHYKSNKHTEKMNKFRKKYDDIFNYINIQKKVDPIDLV